MKLHSSKFPLSKFDTLYLPVNNLKSQKKLTSESGAIYFPSVYPTGLSFLIPGNPDHFAIQKSGPLYEALGWLWQCNPSVWDMLIYQEDRSCRQRPAEYEKSTIPIGTMRYVSIILQRYMYTAYIYIHIFMYTHYTTSPPHLHKYILCNYTHFMFVLMTQHYRKIIHYTGNNTLGWFLRSLFVFGLDTVS